MRVTREVLSATHKRNHTITNDEQLLASTYSESAVSFLYNNKSHRNDNNDKVNIGQKKAHVINILEYVNINNF